MIDPTVFETSAREHAQLVRERYAGVIPPPVETLARPRAWFRDRVVAVVGTAAAAVVVGVALWTGQSPQPVTLPIPSTTTSTGVATGAVQAPATPENPPELRPGWEHVGQYLVPHTGEAHVAADAEGEGMFLVVSSGTYRWTSAGTLARIADSPMSFAGPCCTGYHMVSTAQGLFAFGERESWLLDVGRGTWRELPPRPFPGDMLGVARLGSSLVVVQAADRVAHATSQVAALDVDTLTWATWDTLPQPISVGGLTTDGRRLFVVGTHQDGSNGILGGHVAEVLTPDTGWETLPEVPISGQSATVAWVGGDDLVAWNYLGETVLFDGRRWVAGPGIGELGECRPRAMGSPGAGLTVAQCYSPVAIYDAASRVWSTVPPATDQAWNNSSWYVATDTEVLGILAQDGEEILLLRYPLPRSSAD